MNQVRILQMKLQLGTLVVMKVMCQNTPCKEKHMTQPDYKDSSTGISAKGLPTRIMGLATYASHKWQDKAFLKEQSVWPSL